jgi:3-hydroxyacyl-CoA dehydrogenase/enoyl-CoA hydratase/3-hydroxybutyryl-CoA epimerase
VGFYAYDPPTGDAGPKRGVDRDRAVRSVLGLGPPADVEPDALLERLLLTMVGEAVRTLEDGVLMSAADGDIGAVFGLGFPPYTGGPFRYVDDETPQAVVLRMARLARAHGPRFEPPALLRRHAEGDTRFHADGRG